LIDFIFQSPISLIYLEKRAKFDAGEDPLDAEEQAQQHNPFQGFNPFGAGNGQGFTFRFHFN
jgi:DnaJ family protein C protein 3